MSSKKRAIYSVEFVKVMKNTAGAGKSPFYAKVEEYKYYRLFGILIKKVTITGEFPDPDDKR
jgi:hypothetical protein